VNVHEERFWKVLIELGAREVMLGGKHAIDLRPIRITSARKLGLFCQAIIEVVGRSNANRRHPSAPMPYPRYFRVATCELRRRSEFDGHDSCGART